jgi:hypothetical protein
MNIDRQPNMHDLSWFVDMDNQKRLDLNPPYQRKSVWTATDRYYFLDTIFNNYPCPAVYVQKEIGSDGPKYNVVDGKQRLSTILNFYNNKIKLPKNFSIPRLAGKRFRDLEKDDIIAFYNYVFLVETLKASGDTEWNEVFFRVNRNQKRLTEQELRHARFDGWFITRAEDEIESTGIDRSQFWSTVKISTSAKSRRMKDIEFISTLMLVILEKDFVGFPQSNIDELYAKYDFELALLPSEDAGISEVVEEVQDGEADDFAILREDIDKFEEKFAAIKSFISEMEAHNGAVTKHSRRLTTDFYSLWSILALSDVMERFTAASLAICYDTFISGIDGIYDKVRVDKARDDEPKELPPTSGDADLQQQYYTHSIGAATTTEYRKSRHEALHSYFEANAS